MEEYEMKDRMVENEMDERKYMRIRWKGREMRRNVEECL